MKFFKSDYCILSSIVCTFIHWK